MDINRVVFRQINKGSFPSGEVIKPITIERGKGILLPDWQADEINSVVKYIQAKTEPKEIVFSFPDQGTYNFLADRPCFSRFCLVDMASYREDWSDEFFLELETKKPRYIICKREIDVFEPFLSQYPVAQNRNRLREFIKRYYQLEISFGRIDIYRLVDEKK